MFSSLQHVTRYKIQKDGGDLVGRMDDRGSWDVCVENKTQVTEPYGLKQGLGDALLAD